MDSSQQPSAFSYGHQQSPIRIVVCVQDEQVLNRVCQALEQMPPNLVASRQRTTNLEDLNAYLNSDHIDAIYIDPLQDLERTSEFVFDVRARLPHIVFVLVADPSKMSGREHDFYAGERLRYHHYFRLDPMVPDDQLRWSVETTVHQIRADIRVDSSTRRIVAQRSRGASPPVEITASLDRFRQKWPTGTLTGFVAMSYESAEQVSPKVREPLRRVLDRYGVTGLWADEADLHPHLHLNILTYLHASSFVFAVFDRDRIDSVNPNVSFEVGYALALGKPVCLLKANNLQALHSDLAGSIFKSYDIQDVETSLDKAIGGWLADRAAW